MYMSERFGAWQVGNDPVEGKIEFRIFYPDRSKDPSQYDLIADREKYGNPEVKRIQVIGTFQSHIGQPAWDEMSGPDLTKKSHPKGDVWEYTTPIKLPAGFYEYKYLLTFDDDSTRIVGDPCARYGGSENQNSGLAVGGSDPTVNAIGERKNLRDLVQYELMIDDFTDEYRRARAPIDAVRDKLDYLKVWG